MFYFSLSLGSGQREEESEARAGGGEIEGRGGDGGGGGMGAGKVSVGRGGGIYILLFQGGVLHQGLHSFALGRRPEIEKFKENKGKQERESDENGKAKTRGGVFPRDCSQSEH